ncbi:SpaA isopeptide-forming pilin-related protein [Streptomyces albipurpureus]|uniref:SpaA isopeptide-forming pilin-related protein n=1 Tax=Streptomyces albipurpureus TaxID=2897419 RepID=A0ABT0UQP7_9ACTN|nr:SpaA isopeptide-forming pilin-related protein [Streptomyces sp. CWNU-1]MCM2390750.1 SpaA isopeptide-forming pilin-related protein [Streptomyces sp. CWNU-1]
MTLRSVLALLLAVPILFAYTPAQAAGGTLNVSVEVVSETVRSGQGASFRVQWTCSGSGTCDGAKISVPVPTALASSDAFPGGVPLTVTSQSSLQINGAVVPGAATIVGTAPDQTLVWTFPATVTTGTSDTVSFTLTPPNSVTPDGATITPEVTFAATGTAAVTDSATTTVTSDISLNVAKVKHSPTGVPYVDQQVTYSILVGYDSQIPTTGAPTGYARKMADACSELGTQALENLTVVDTLPTGARFVSATHGGVYDSAANTITWSLGSSIYDTPPYACTPNSGSTTWTGTPLRATAVYPDGEFSADPDPSAVTNSVVATANAWGQSSETLSSDDSTSHALREGAAGASVEKRPGYDFAIGSPLYRTVHTQNNNIYSLSGTSDEPTAGRWTFTDMMPCGLTSPTDENDIDCATPAFVDLQFSADRYLPESQVNWTTNAGSTGSCTIAAGTSMSDTAKRYCDGTNSTTPTPVPAGEWITKIEVDTEIPAFGGGSIFIHGRVSKDVPFSNVDTVYTNPNLDVDRSDVHPWYVTVENCPLENVITFEGGRQYRPYEPQTADSNAGICGYRQVMTNPFTLRPVKSMYDPAIPKGSRPATPAVQTGDVLTVDLAMNRSRWNAGQAVLDASTFTPTVTEYLPAALTMVEDSLQIVPDAGGDAPLVAALGEPDVAVETVDYLGERRKRVTVTFPDAEITSFATLGRTAYVRFQVRVNQGVPAGVYTNNYLLTGAEGGPGVPDTYLQCGQGTLVDADLKPTTDRAAAIGCLASASFNVLPVAGVNTSKTVQGAYDADPIGARGVGATDLSGEAEYAIRVANPGSVDIRNVVAYDMLPRIGDSLILPGAQGARDSAFPVHLTGPVTAPAGATLRYSTSANPCRGDLAGTGGGAVNSAPAGCANDWAATPPGGDYEAVTALRIDFGSRVFAPGDSESAVLAVKAAGPNTTTSADLDGIAWNNTAVAGVEASSGRPILPTEASAVGLQLLPDVAWQKTDSRTGDLLAGSEWTLAPVLKDGEKMPDGWPLTITDCTDAPCSGADQDPAAGQFRLAGIPWGDYTLTETTAPSGHLPLEDPIEVNVDPADVDRGSYLFDLGKIENDPRQGEWTLSKTSDPASGTTVNAGDTITYTLTVANDSQYPVHGIALTDNLSDVLDDATFGSFTDADDGRAVRASDDTITWNVDELAAGATRTVTYTVTVLPDGQRGDNRLGNVLAPTGTTDPDCEDERVSCTEHPVPLLDSWKAVEADRTPVAAGTVLTYTLFFENTGEAPATVESVDLLDHVTDDADVTTEPTSSDGLTAARDGNRITITGEVPAGETYEATYRVTVKADGKRGDDIAANFLLPDDPQNPPVPPTDPVCRPDDAQRPDCTVTPIGRLLTGKTVSADTAPVETGTVLTYTLTFDNQGEAPSAVGHTDILTDVLDDTDLTRDPVASDDALRVSPVTDGSFTVTGELQPGQTVTVTYQMTVKDEADRGNNTADNFLIPTGEQPPSECAEGDANCTVTPLPNVAAVKSSNPESGSTVLADQEITYTLTFTNTGKAAGPVDHSDQLEKVLDDADLTGAPTSSDPALSATSGQDGIIRVTGTLTPGQTVTVKYTVTVKPDGKRGDNRLGNVLAATENTAPQCGEDGVSCTEHPIPEIVDTKSVNPASGTPVVPGQELTYSLTFTNTGKATGAVDKADDLTHVLDDATVTGEPVASDDAFTVSRDGNRIRITGQLKPGQTVTVSYTVKVNPTGKRGDNVLANYLLDPSQKPPTEPVCEPGKGKLPDCTTNPVGDIAPAKSVDPRTGTTVDDGQVLTYTLSFTNTGRGPAPVEYTDHLADVLDDATWAGRITASDGLTVTGPAGNTLLITGTVAPDQTATVTYQVKIKAHDNQGDHHLGNFLTLTGQEPPTECVPENPLCTKNPTDPPATPESEGPGGFLPKTGAQISATVLAAALLLGLGSWMVVRSRRR